LSSLSTLPASTLNTEYGPLLNCLCAWDRANEVLDLINEWIAAGMNGTTREARMVLYSAKTYFWRFSIECRKTKTKVITLIHHLNHKKQCKKPIRIGNNCVLPAHSFK